MNNIFYYLLIGYIFINIISCHPLKPSPFQSRIVYNTEHLIITQVSENTFQHTTYLHTNSFGKVSCNGMIVRSNKEIIIYDTPPDDSTAQALIQFTKDSLGSRIVAVIATHFHVDCLGGLEAFHQQDIPSYAHDRTISLAKEHKLPIPQNGFDSMIQLKVGNTHTITTFFGEGHTRDNVVGYFPADKILFGGCLIKEMNANKGNLDDANVNDWSKTVQRIKSTYPAIQQVIPGHGKMGNAQLLDYTIQLFNVQ